jgi:hydrogenase nickel incorporation protein HypA/HybF
MHESAVAMSVVEQILAEAQKHNARPKTVRISCGQFNALNDEAMQVAFEAASMGTLCEGVKLTIDHKPLQTVCKSCGHSFHYDIYSGVCPGCGGEELSFEADAPLLLEEIELEQDSPNESNAAKKDPRQE